MSENKSSKISHKECLIKSEHIILEKKPFVIITINEQGNGMIMSENLIHTGEMKGIRQKLDIAVLEYTQHIHPIIKLMWAAGKSNLMMGDQDNGE